METRAVLDTPEGVQLTFRLAGPGLRMGAYAIDLAVRALVYVVCAVLLGSVFGLLAGVEVTMGMQLVIVFLLEWFYGTLFEWLWNGKTPGKHVCRLRVIKDGGYPIGFYEAALRNLLRAADVLVVLYAVGLAVMMSTARLQRLGDLVAGTMVVIEDRERVRYRPRDLQAVPAIPRAECRRGYHVSERTLDVISRLFERSGYVAGMRRENIASILAQPIARQLGFDLETLRPRDRGSRFLIRVLKTFGTPGETDENDVPSDDRQGRGQPVTVNA